MQALMVMIKIKAGYQNAFMEAMLSDARGSVYDEPGCLRFDALQDARIQTRFICTKCTEMRGQLRPTAKRPTSLNGTRQ